MATATIKKILNSDIQSVWKTVLCVEQYSRWRSDLSKTQLLRDGQFIEYTKDGFATHFTVTQTQAYRRWEFDLENSRIRGHWTGLFTAQGRRTQIEFTECVTAKNPLMKPFIKLYLQRQQAQFVQDLKRELEAQHR